MVKVGVGGGTGRTRRSGARRTSRLIVAAACAAIAAYGVSWVATSSASTAKVAAGAGSGGSLTVLLNTGFEGAWPSGLDPSTDTNGLANQDMMTSIFGDLFQLGPKGKIIPDLATGYKFVDGGKVIDMTIRNGVKFSNGDRFTAAMVAKNITRDLASPCTCSPTSAWTTLAKTNPVTVSGNVVAVHFTAPYGAFISSIISSDANWIADLNALQTMGASAFQNAPVGAGPFTVVSDTPSQEIVLKRNPGYWQSGYPLLQNLTFKTVANDEAAYEAMQAGQGQVYIDASSPQIEAEAAKTYKVVEEKSTSPYDIQFNTSIAPFNNIEARQAIYYATNAKQIDDKLFNNLFPLTESFTAPGGLFYEPKVPGYIGYNLAKAKALVKKLGGLTVNFFTIAIPTAEEATDAMAAQWQAAGIKVTTANYPLAPLISQFTGGKWQVALQTAGAWDPAQGVGVGFRFDSHSPFSGVHSTQLDTILENAAGSTNLATRKKDYAAAAALIAKEAWGPFLFSYAPDQIFAKNVTGPGLSIPLPAVAVSATVLWQDVTATK
ncbi:MAG TPA: ABC transporter substrate-binding protein [Solirubrobacteraceae bacterium]|jgi:peptide/nickel transport system substrate-binding protein|nr:ABC transporter substrate-binding protein [Solirubrobacteraceae bacterium]